MELRLHKQAIAALTIAAFVAVSPLLARAALEASVTSTLVGDKEKEIALIAIDKTAEVAPET